MVDLLKARKPTETSTMPRSWDDDTETEIRLDSLPPPVQKRGPGLAFSVALVHPEADSNGDIIDWAGQHEFTLPASDDRKSAIPKPPGDDLPSRVQRAIALGAPSPPLAGSDLEEVMERVLLYDVSIRLDRAPSSTSSPKARRCYERFRGKLIATLLDEPIEDGVTHPAEQVITEALRASSSNCRDWLSRVLVEHYEARPSLSASIVRCIGRLEYDQVGRWGIRVADDALRHGDVEVREAAVRALEAWGGSEALRMLRSHGDSVAWLDEYVSQVIVDLSGTAS